MLSATEKRLKQKAKQTYLKLPLGIRRLWIASSVIWLAVYAVLNWADLSLLWKGATSGPNATCAQVYSNDQERQSSCEIVNGLPDITFYMQGKSKSFQSYFEKYRRDDKLLIWLGAPLAWLAVLWAVIWVRRGFDEVRKK